MFRSSTAAGLEARAGPATVGPKRGDLLVSKRSAHADRYTLSRVPHAPVFEVRGEARAIALGTRLAAQAGIAAWYTENQRHFRRLADAERARRTS